MNANLELYRIFCEVVKYKNISKAAENIYNLIMGDELHGGNKSN